MALTFILGNLTSGGVSRGLSRRPGPKLKHTSEAKVKVPLAVAKTAKSRQHGCCDRNTAALTREMAGKQ